MSRIFAIRMALRRSMRRSWGVRPIQARRRIASLWETTPTPPPPPPPPLPIASSSASHERYALGAAAGEDGCSDALQVKMAAPTAPAPTVPTLLLPQRVLSIPLSQRASWTGVPRCPPPNSLALHQNLDLHADLLDNLRDLSPSEALCLWKASSVSISRVSFSGANSANLCFSQSCLQLFLLALPPSLPPLATCSNDHGPAKSAFTCALSIL